MYVECMSLNQNEVLSLLGQKKSNAVNWPAGLHDRQYHIGNSALVSVADRLDFGGATLAQSALVRRNPCICVHA